MEIHFLQRLINLLHSVRLDARQLALYNAGDQGLVVSATIDNVKQSTKSQLGNQILG
jgi:hypothetical protein